MFTTVSGGVNNNFKTAFKHASGDLIIPCDQDDIWMPNKVEVLEKNMTDDVDIVYGQDYIFKDDDMSTRREDVWYIEPMKVLAWRNCLKGHTCMFRRSILNIYDHSGKLSWDYTLALYGCISKRCTGLPDFLMYFRRHSTALTVGSLSYDESTKVLPDNEALSSWQKFVKCNAYLLWKREYVTQKNKDFLMCRADFLDNMMLERSADIHVGVKMVKCYKNTLYFCAKQTFLSMLVAGCYCMRGNMLEDDYETLSLKQKLGRMKYAFFTPYIYWMDIYKIDYL